MGEMFHDKNGRPIYPGDLLKSYHFTGARRKKYYLYHTAVEIEGELWAVPTSELEPSKAGRGGRGLLKHFPLGQAEIISGYGPGPSWDYTDRPKKAPEIGGGDGE